MTLNNIKVKPIPKEEPSTYPQGHRPIKIMTNNKPHPINQSFKPYSLITHKEKCKYYSQYLLWY